MGKRILVAEFRLDRFKDRPEEAPLTKRQEQERLKKIRALDSAAFAPEKERTSSAGRLPLRMRQDYHQSVVRCEAGKRAAKLRQPGLLVVEDRCRKEYCYDSGNYLAA